MQELQKAGFDASPNDYVEFTAIFRQYTGDRPGLKYYLACILCRNAEEQAKFYEIYDRYFIIPAVEQPVVGVSPEWMSSFLSSVIGFFRILGRLAGSFSFRLLLFVLLCGTVKVIQLLRNK